LKRRNIENIYGTKHLKIENGTNEIEAKQFFLKQIEAKH